MAVETVAIAAADEEEPEQDDKNESDARTKKNEHIIPC